MHRRRLTATAASPHVGPGAPEQEVARRAPARLAGREDLHLVRRVVGGEGARQVDRARGAGEQPLACLLALEAVLLRRARRCPDSNDPGCRLA